MIAYGWGVCKEENGNVGGQAIKSVRPGTPPYSGRVPGLCGPN